MNYPGPKAPSRGGKLQEGIGQTMGIPQISTQLDKGCEGTTHGLVVKLAEPMQDLRDHWRPCRYIFGLSVGLEFCVVLEDA